jgi:hypothetical protein
MKYNKGKTRRIIRNGGKEDDENAKNKGKNKPKTRKTDKPKINILEIKTEPQNRNTGFNPTPVTDTLVKKNLGNFNEHDVYDTIPLTNTINDDNTTINDDNTTINDEEEEEDKKEEEEYYDDDFEEVNLDADTISDEEEEEEEEEDYDDDDFEEVNLDADTTISDITISDITDNEDYTNDDKDETSNAKPIFKKKYKREEKNKIISFKYNNKNTIVSTLLNQYELTDDILVLLDINKKQKINYQRNKITELKSFIIGDKVEITRRIDSIDNKHALNIKNQGNIEDIKRNYFSIKTDKNESISYDYKNVTIKKQNIKIGGKRHTKKILKKTAKKAKKTAKKANKKTAKKAKKTAKKHKKKSSKKTKRHR